MKKILSKVAVAALSVPAMVSVASAAVPAAGGATLSSGLTAALAGSTVTADVASIGGWILTAGVAIYGLAKLRGILKA